MLGPRRRSTSSFGSGRSVERSTAASRAYCGWRRRPVAQVAAGPGVSLHPGHNTEMATGKCRCMARASIATSMADLLLTAIEDRLTATLP